ncbi:MAG TPA: hypothetical protein VKT28_16390 [Puia sp.]|nr:hypothetical protein [Puia sp.]
MKSRLSILNLSALLFLIGIIIYTILKYKQLSEGEGWGVVAMVGLFGAGIVLLVIDFIIQKIFKSRTIVNITGAIVAVIAVFFLLKG